MGLFGLCFGYLGLNNGFHGLPSVGSAFSGVIQPLLRSSGAAPPPESLCPPPEPPYRPPSRVIPPQFSLPVLLYRSSEQVLESLLLLESTVLTIFSPLLATAFRCLGLNNGFHGLTSVGSVFSGVIQSLWRSSGAAPPPESLCAPMEPPYRPPAWVIPPQLSLPVPLYQSSERVLESLLLLEWMSLVVAFPPPSMSTVLAIISPMLATAFRWSLPVAADGMDQTFYCWKLFTFVICAALFYACRVTVSETVDDIRTFSDSVPPMCGLIWCMCCWMQLYSDGLDLVNTSVLDIFSHNPIGYFGLNALIVYSQLDHLMCRPLEPMSLLAFSRLFRLLCVGYMYFLYEY